jgi:HlyD family secretion protein
MSDKLSGNGIADPTAGQGAPPPAGAPLGTGAGTKVATPRAGMDIARPKPRRSPRVLYAVGAAVALAAVTAFLGRLQRAAPSVERSSLWIDQVKRGDMLRAVRGPGTLVPEQIRLITAETAGRVEKIALRPGAAVQVGTELLELSNPDVQLQALEAERQLASAQAELLNLKSTLEAQNLSQRASLATLRTDLAEARRRATANEKLVSEHLASDYENRQTAERADELVSRMKLEQDRLEVMEQGMRDRLSAQRAQIDKLRAVAEFRRQQVESMQVKSTGNGVLQELPLELGQWVTPGTLLARVVEPDKLKAELHIPETQAKDLARGQRAQVDTRNGIVPGTVSRIAPAASQGTVLVEIALEGTLPKGARPDLTVEGTVELEKLNGVLYVGRPAGAQPEQAMELFRVDASGDEAARTRVKLGRASVNSVEVQDGLREGDRVVLSDMSNWDGAERIKLK